MSRAAFRELISGSASGPGTSLFRGILSVLACCYRLGVTVRNFAYDHGWKRVHRATVPVISLGNLTAGGTGKTPFAAFVARWFCERGVRVCFLSRGYGAQASSPSPPLARGGASDARLSGAPLNDEARVLAQLCPDVPHLQQADRVAGARRAQSEFGCQLLILDDGFQHRRLARDLDIVLIDATDPWGFSHLLPRGLLREPVSSLKRADLVVLTRVDQVSREVVQEIRRRIGELRPEATLVEVAFPPERLIDAAGKTASLASLRGQSVAVFSGLGNPESFERSVAVLGCPIAGTRRFPDHHDYSADDVRGLETWAAGLGAAAIVTTQKDLVKFQQQKLGLLPLWAVQIGTRIVAGADAFERRLQLLVERTGAAGR